MPYPFLIRTGADSEIPKHQNSGGMQNRHQVEAVTVGTVADKPCDRLVHEDAAERASAGDHAKGGAENGPGHDINHQRRQAAQPGCFGVRHNDAESDGRGQGSHGENQAG